MGYNKYHNNNIRPYQKNEQIHWFRVDGRPICVKKCSLTTVTLGGGGYPGCPGVSTFGTASP